MGIGQITNSYAEPTSQPKNNRGCAVVGVDTASDLLSSEQSGCNANDLGTGNTYATSCANIARPPLFPQMVVPPDLLDAQGGFDALTTSTTPGRTRTGRMPTPPLRGSERKQGFGAPFQRTAFPIWHEDLRNMSVSRSVSLITSYLV